MLSFADFRRGFEIRFPLRMDLFHYILSRLLIFCYIFQSHKTEYAWPPRIPELAWTTSRLPLLLPDTSLPSQAHELVLPVVAAYTLSFPLPLEPLLSIRMWSPPSVLLPQILYHR